MLRTFVALMLSVSGTAFACSCPDPMISFPKRGATNVPTNVVIRARRTRLTPTEEPFRLVRRVDQREVTFVIGDGTPFATFTPVEPLAANTEYELSDGTNTTTFTTGSSEDLDVPSRPALKSSSYERFDRDDSCGERRIWSLQFDGGDDGTTAKDQLLILAFDEGSRRPVGFTSFVSPELVSAFCGTNFAAPEVDSFALRFQVVDLAGHVSELSASHTVSGCSATSSGTLSMLALSLLLRRRSSRS